MSVKVHRFTIGKLECLGILDNAADRPMSRLFAHIPEADRARAAQALNYDPEAVPFSYMPLAVKTGDQWVLIDTGHVQTEDGGNGKLLEGLRDAGVALENVTVVHITHCHGDHIGGLTGADGALHFANARYTMGKAEWDHWMSEETLAQLGEDYAKFLREKLLPIKGKLTLLEGEAEIVPGLTAVPMPGHTPGHTGVRVQSDGETLLHMVDVAHMEVQLMHPDWSPAFDLDPEQAAAARREVFARAAQDKVLVMDYHFPFPSLGHIVPHGDVWKWQPVVA